MKNDDLKKIGFDLSLLTKVFQLNVANQSLALETWLNDSYTLTDIPVVADLKSATQRTGFQIPPNGTV